MSQFVFDTEEKYTIGAENNCNFMFCQKIKLDLKKMLNHANAPSTIEVPKASVHLQITAFCLANYFLLLSRHPSHASYSDVSLSPCLTTGGINDFSFADYLVPQS